ncbi:unnamed protein product [Ixodes pacificus]
MNAIPKLSPRPCSTLDVPELGLQHADPLIPRPRANVPLYLLLESLLEQLCIFYENDASIRKELFLALRRRLSQLQLLDHTPDLQEVSSIRLRFRRAFGALVGDVKRNLRSLPDDTLVPVPGPRQDFAIHGFDEVDGRQGRYLYDFEEIGEIAQGGFGIVCKAKKRMDGYVYAIKKIPFKYYDHKLLKQILREVELLAQLSHPHVVAYKTAWIENMPVVTVTEGLSAVDSCQSTIPLSSMSHTYGNTTSPSCHCSSQQASKNSSGMPRPSLQRSTSLFTESDDSNCVNNGDPEGRCASLQEPSDANIVFASNDSLFSSTEFHMRVRHSSRSDNKVRKSMTDTFKYSRRKTSSDESGERRIVTAREHAFQLLNASASICVLFIQMELCSGNLADWLASRNLKIEEGLENRSVNIEEALAIFKQILKGVQYIHSQGLIHRDLKPQNILFDSKGSTVKLGDFGLATMNCQGNGQELGSHQWRQSLGHTQGVGTSLYAAPEQRQAFYDAKVDIYSLGVVLTELACPFFTAHERISELQKLHQGCLPTLLRNHLPSVASTVQAMCHQDPKERPSAAETLHSPLFIAKDEIIKGLKNKLVKHQKEIEDLKESLRKKTLELQWYQERYGPSSLNQQ